MAIAPSVQALKLNFTIPIAPGVTRDRFVYCYLIFGETITPDTSGDAMTELTVIHTPGHSPGSISLFMKDTGILFSGDSIPVQGGFPIYDDPEASVASIKRLRELEGVNILFSSWDHPAEGPDAYLRMDIGPAAIQRVHATVLASGAEGATDPTAIADRTIATLSLQGQVPGPLIARTIAGHLELQEIPNLLD